MKLVTSAIFALGLAAGAAPAIGHEVCRATVLTAELSPFAPSGTWLTTALLELRSANAPPLDVTVREFLPWQLAIREGEVFSFPCEQASGDGLRLSGLASAAGRRHGAGPYARLR